MTKRVHPQIYCTECGKEINYRAKSGLCIKHFTAKINADPEVRELQRAGNVAYCKENPDAVRRRGRKIALAVRSNPERIAHLRIAMREKVQPQTCTPEAVARRDHAARGRAISAAKLAWCPPEHRAEYRHLVRYKALPGAVAKAIILDQIKADRARLSPFERQEADLAAKLARGEEAVASNDMFRRRAA